MFAIKLAMLRNSIALQCSVWNSCCYGNIYSPVVEEYYVHVFDK